jgi:hypothetical protein
MFVLINAGRWDPNAVFCSKPKEDGFPRREILDAGTSLSGFGIDL